MKKLALAALLISTGALAQTPEVYVVSVQPRMVTVQQQRCEQVAVQAQDNSTAGTVLGGVAGGLLGHHVGGGSGQTAATIIGAVGGAVLGNNMGKPDTQPQYRQVCSYQPIQIQQGEIVTFSYRGRQFSQTFP